MSIENNLRDIERRVGEACERSGREISEVKTMAVSKKHPPKMIEEAANLGLELFGENRIQESKVKIPLCPTGLEWHFIGHLQSNKAKDAVRLFHMIQGVDSRTLAHEIEKQAEKLTKQIPILIEVNIAGEASKFGYPPEKVLDEISELCHLSRVEVHGFMGMAPISSNPERTRPIFRKLNDLRKKCEDKVGIPFPVLSMGMSQDFEVAIEEGATIVRLGTLLFGKRPT